MKRISLLALLLASGLACDATGGNFEPDPLDPTVDTDTDTDDRLPPPSTQGVQIGSEGIIGDCTARAVASTDLVPGFTGTAGDVTDTVFGTFDGTLVADTDVAGSLGLSASSWGVVEGLDCPTLLLAGVDANLRALPNLDAALTGWALIVPDGTLELSLWAPSWTGTATPVLDPADFDSVELRFDGATDLMLTGSLGFEACVGTTCSLEDYGTFAAPL